MSLKLEEVILNNDNAIKAEVRLQGPSSSANKTPVQATPNPYRHGCLIVIGLIWLWNAKAVFPIGDGAAEAIGYDLFSIGLPVLLLWNSTTRLKASLQQRNIAAPYQWIFGAIAFLWGLISFIDAFRPTTVHKVGAILQWLVTWMAALILFIVAESKD